MIKDETQNKNGTKTKVDVNVKKPLRQHICKVVDR